MGSKYVFKPDSNPPVGAYEVNESQTKFNNKSVIIREDIIKEKRVQAPAPDAGMYDKHLIPLGAELKNINFGRPYVFKPDSNPPVGAYDVKESQTKF